MFRFEVLRLRMAEKVRTKWITNKQLAIGVVEEVARVILCDAPLTSKVCLL